MGGRDVGGWGTALKARALENHWKRHVPRLSKPRLGEKYASLQYGIIAQAVMDKSGGVIKP